MYEQAVDGESTMTKYLKRTACLALVLSSACSNNVPTHFYALDALLPQKPLAAAQPKEHQAHIIGIGPVSLPALLNRKSIVTRMAQPAIQITDSQQWAEPLLDNVTRVLARNIAALQAQDTIYAYPWALVDAVEQRVVINVLQFDAKLGETVEFEAVWSIKQEQQQHVLRRGHTRLKQALKTPEYAEMVTAMNQILADFSTELSGVLLTMP